MSDLAGATRFDLYELCVQCPPIEARFLEAVHGANPLVLGEDFCGPAAVARAWLALSPDHRAVCTDADEAPLRHAAARLAETAPNAVDRLTLRHRDVLEVGDRADVVAALNFAVCELHERERLLTYLRAACYRLEAGGVFACDVYGGPDALVPGTAEQLVETDEGVVRYLWEQRTADPVTARVTNAIHFVLPGGERIDDAFTYDWRLWTAPELHDALLEAGFRSTEVHASYGDAMDESGRLLVRPVDPGDVDGSEAFVLYVVGRV